MWSFLKSFIRKKKNDKKISNLLQLYKDLDTYQIAVNGNIVYFDTTDDFSRLWYHASRRSTEYHEPHLSKQFIHHIQEGHVVFDIGSLIGYFVCMASELVGKSGEVHAFEIDKKCLPLIEKSIVLNNYKNVKINNVAVCDRIGIERITQSDNIKFGEMLSVGSQKNSIEIEATSIDKYIELSGVFPDLIKIDVEGSELRVLKGMQQLLLKGKVKLLIEIHVKKLKQFYNVHYKELIQFLHDMDYILELIPEDNKLGKRLIVDQNTLLEDNSLIYAFREEKLDGT
jgi:FkbM family methyltransferase